MSGPASYLNALANRWSGTIARADQQWLAAPVAVFNSSGFGDETWDVKVSQTLLAWVRQGCVISEVPGFLGRTAPAGQMQYTLQVADEFTRYRAGKVSFGNLFVPDVLVRHVAEELSLVDCRPNILRNDLIMIPDEVMWRHLDDYARRAYDPEDVPSRVEMESRAVLVVERLLAARHGKPRLQPGGSTVADWRLRRAVEYLDAHLADNVGLAELSGAVGLTTTHLTTLFRAGTGEPPHRWLMRRRFERACEMLADPRVSVTEVATACGFASSQHLATVFRKRLGVSPTEYRRERLS